MSLLHSFIFDFLIDIISHRLAFTRQSYTYSISRAGCFTLPNHQTAAKLFVLEPDPFHGILMQPFGEFETLAHLTSDNQNK
jgi:hypothetical protein